MVRPNIDPVIGDDRPLWSVMIPAWNAESVLGRTIESVLASDLPAGSQIEVVDDVSTDRTRAIAESYAAQGVGYYGHRQRQGGAPANFNACIRRAKGRLIHILHADDEVVAGFYSAMGRAMANEAVVAAFSRTHYIDEAGKVLKTTRREAPSGIWHNAVATLGVSNRIRPPTIVVRRTAYEAVGGFCEDLVHAADWDMWMRLARHGPIWFEDAILGHYRVHPEQDTLQQIRSGTNISERLAALRIVNEGLPKSSLRKGLLYTAVFAGRTSLQLMKKAEWRASLTQLKAAARCALAGLVGSTIVAGAQDL